MVDVETEDNSDELDDGFPYEGIGNEIELRLTQTGWVTPTPYMVCELHDLLRAMVRIYGRNGHPLLRELGRANFKDLSFIDGLGLGYFLGLRSAVIRGMPPDELAKMGYEE